MEADKKVGALPGKGGAQARVQSTIEFPYLDEENAVEIATAVHEVGGSGCEWDQLAAHLKQAAQGGGFRLRMICAKQFGLVLYDRGKVTLTSLGLRVVDPQQLRAAKVEAFLQVPLYKAVYEKFRGGTLPPLAGLEREMQALGVAPKQADKARQAFQRSAKYAGFFEFGADRLVPPPTAAASEFGTSKADKGSRESVGTGGGGGGDDGIDVHPALLGLLRNLPPVGSPLGPKRRSALIDAFKSTINFIYPEDEEKL